MANFDDGDLREIEAVIDDAESDDWMVTVDAELNEQIEFVACWPTGIEVHPGGGRVVCSPPSGLDGLATPDGYLRRSVVLNDFRLAVTARNSLQALIDDLREARQERDQLLERLVRIEGDGNG